MLKINALSKSYKDVKAIKEVSVHINETEFIAFLGPSGCGKSTLLKLVAGLLQPTGGEILLEGKRVNQPSKELGMVFQDYLLFPWLTVKDNIGFGLRIGKVSNDKRSEIVQHYLSVTGLKEFANAFPKSLSGGMKQRVAIARTLANDPRVILMDEPFGSLDNITRGRMQEFLTSLWEREKKTILFVTHDVEEALFLADRIYVMSERPSVVKKVFDVGFSRPRKQSLKQSKEFFDLRNKVIGYLGY